MASYSSNWVISKLKADGWYEVRRKGDHRQFNHAAKMGTVTVPHPVKDLSIGLVAKIFKQAGITNWK